MSNIKIPGNVSLTLLDRVCLLNILPREGNFATLKIVRKLRESLSFSEEEFKDYNLVFTQDRVTWNDAGKLSLKEVHIGEMAHKIICEPLQKLNDDGKLMEEHLSVYEKFVE